MRANSSRRLRFAFDGVADAYDAGRPRFDDAVVEQLMSHAGLRSGDRVLEIGAGTGQLTEALLRAGLRVEALEPGARLAARLQSKLGGIKALKISDSTFEEYGTD